MPNERILVAAEEQADLNVVPPILRGQGYEVTGLLLPSESPEAFVQDVDPDLAVVAVGGGSDEAAALGQRLRAVLGVPVVLLLGEADRAPGDSLAGVLPLACVVRPVRPADLRVAVELALARHREEARVQEEAEQYRLLFHRNVAGVYRKDMNGVILQCNEAFASLFGYHGPEELVGRHAEILYASPADRRAFLKRLKRKGGLSNYELPMRQKDGTPLWVLENVALTSDPESQEEVVVGTLIDITDRKTLEVRLERLANQDPLTGLANRRALEARAQQVLHLARRRGESVALLFLDLVRFKAINDTKGHRAGDMVLAEVARRIEETLRASDVAARVGGDEFVVLLPGMEGERGARAAGHRVVVRLAPPIEVEGEALRVRARIGIALFPDHGQSLDELMARAGRVVAEVKSETSSTVAVYDAD